MHANYNNKKPVFFPLSSGKFKVPIGGNAKAGEARQTIAEMATQLLELEGEHIEVVQNTTAAGKRGIISDAELDMLLDRRKEVFEGRGVGWKSGGASASVSASVKNRSGGVAGVDRAISAAAAAAASPGPGPGPGPAGRRADVDRSGLFEVYQAPKDEGNDALAHMLGEEVAA
jgi:ATP-dependent DNA helicase